MNAKQIKRYDGPATMEIKLQGEDGAITTVFYLLPDWLLSESVFEKTCDTARSLSDAAEALFDTRAYENIRQCTLPRKNNL